MIRARTRNASNVWRTSFVDAARCWTSRPRGAVRFPRAVKKLLQDARRRRDRRDANEISEHGLLIAIGQLQATRDRLLRGKRSNAANKRLANHLDKHRDELFTCLWRPGVDAGSIRPTGSRRRRRSVALVGHRTLLSAPDYTAQRRVQRNPGAEDRQRRDR